MPRANRHHIPGCVWHITHRCHDRKFLLKFARDRRRWIHWLFEARKRHDLAVLNFMVTSNHIHLLVVDGEDEEAIPRVMQLAAGRTAQEYNLRKRRRGAFWEDRYHATAVESGEHLRNCMAYIDLNMCRAGVVSHPARWECCEYHEIHTPRQRYGIVNRQRAARLLGYEEELLNLDGSEAGEPTSADNVSWVTPSGGEGSLLASSKAWFVADLGASHALDQVRVWNFQWDHSSYREFRGGIRRDLLP